MAVKWNISGPGATVLGIDLHAFRLVESEGLAAARLAEELDVTVVYRLGSATRVTAGVSHVWGRAGLAAIGRATGRRTFTYLMTAISF
jgi:hypothetical protein